MAGINTVRVELGDRGYDILIGAGLLGSGCSAIGSLLDGRNAVIVTDETVAALHLPRLAASVDRLAAGSATIVLVPGEQSKSFATLEDLVGQLLDAGVDRKTVLIALGGGVIGDLAGFAASVVMRGIEFVQVPTTLLAQVDSSVGGKTAINTRHGKNLVGAFHQPSLVLIDTDVLGTLPRRELLAGYAEVVKYGLLRDRDFFEWLEVNGERVLGGDPDAQREAVRRSCENKAAVVAADERERGERALLNLGHTFAHALEREAGYDGTLLHGEAVAAGMGMAFDLSVKLGFCTGQDAERVRRHLAASGLPAGIRDLPNLAGADPDRLYANMAHDKKTVQGNIHFVLAREIGEAFTTADVPSEQVVAVLAGRS